MRAANAAKNRRDVREASTRRHDTRRVPSRAAVAGAGRYRARLSAHAAAPLERRLDGAPDSGTPENWRPRYNRTIILFWRLQWVCRVLFPISSRCAASSCMCGAGAGPMRRRCSCCTAGWTSRRRSSSSLTRWRATGR
ncbi:hypothetical protein BVIET440_10036 [Burkholderia vietnamiensis]